MSPEPVTLPFSKLVLTADILTSVEDESNVASVKLTT
ncbi:MAG: hypothetical protein HW374_2172, partial [Bacteroidetes bacterium]|nr:hypothetical protein [Bacteroidota bacterium]